MSQSFKIKPTFLPLVSFAFVVGLCGGVVFGILGSIGFFVSGDLSSGVLVLCLAPFAQALQFALLAALSFPLFSLWCKRFGSPRLEGELQPQGNDHVQRAL